MSLPSDDSGSSSVPTPPELAPDTTQDGVAGSEPDASTLPLLTLRRGVLIPTERARIPVGRPRSVSLVRHLRPGDELLVASQNDERTGRPTLEEVEPTAVLATVVAVTQPRKGPLTLTVEARRRVTLKAFVEAPDDAFTSAEFSEVEPPSSERSKALLAAAAELAGFIRDVDPTGVGTLAEVVRQWTTSDNSLAQATEFADRAALALELSNEQRLEVLRSTDPVTLLMRVAAWATESAAKVDVDETIDRNVREGLYGQQRQAVLREQLKAIQQELGEGGDEDVQKLVERVAAAALPAETRKVAERELIRLQNLPAAGAEHHVVRSYIELIVDLPWETRAGEDDEAAEGATAGSSIDIAAVEAALDADHYGLQDVKTRILEHVAVLKMSGQRRGGILALAGPPGVGKTSLGQSIADGLGRPLVRIALGGVRDEAEIRGHRRTYVGALPGRILSGIRKAGVKNPVVLLDEIDKLGQGWQGSPEAALLEVLDPEQNKHFTDHYLDLPFDLSEVLFICTANGLQALSAPLLDRLEVVEVAGYTRKEKRHIARNHLWPSQLLRHGMVETGPTLGDETLDALIAGFTREAGVRQLNRQLERLCRSLTLEAVRRDKDGKSGNTDKAGPSAITPESLTAHVGRRKFFDEVAEGTRPPGVATGLAWTPVGGSILYIEASRMPGKGGLQTTGQLGDVMTESAKAAMTYIRSYAQGLGIDADTFATSDVHIHVPAGAVPKDGPSAGVTMFTALASLFTGRPVRSDTAMTGECTLRGRVLPVGGIKAKVLAAHRAGVRRVILPERNRHDIEDVPAEVHDDMTFIFASEMGDVLKAALSEETVVTGQLVASSAVADSGSQPAA